MSFFRKIPFFPFITKTNDDILSAMIIRSRRAVISATLVVLAAVALAACGAGPGATAGRATVATAPAGTQYVAPATVAASASPEAVAEPDATPVSAPAPDIVNEDGATLETRFNPPAGYERVPAEAGSFAEYLRKLPLKPHGSAVKYFDGGEKPDGSYIAVVDMDIGTSDLQQCADTVLRLYSEYLYGIGAHERISFHFVSGFLFEWDKWRQGYRVKVEGNVVTWVHSAEAGSGKKAFDAYLKKLYTYASTRSMAHSDLKRVEPRELAIGDMFIKGGSPGHVVLVADMAVQKDTGRKCFMLLQGYMPAQDAQILRNLDEPGISPWVMLPEAPEGEFITPEYAFTWDQAMRFKR